MVKSFLGASANTPLLLLLLQPNALQEWSAAEGGALELYSPGTPQARRPAESRASTAHGADSDLCDRFRSEPATGLNFTLRMWTGSP